MGRYNEFEPDFEYYDEYPGEDPFFEDRDYEQEQQARYGDPQDWENFQAQSDLEFKDGVAERLLETIEEYLGFATKEQLLELINTNF